MPDYRLTFDRIGRNREVPPLKVEAVQDADEIAFEVYSYARKFLASHDVWVTADLETMRGSINAGRFGAFTIESAA